MLPCLTQRKRKVIADAMYDDCKHPIDDNDLRAIGFLPRDKVIAALRKVLQGLWNNSSPRFSPQTAKQASVEASITIEI